MFPEIFFKGWWKQPHEIIREAMGLLRISRWGRSAWGQQVLKAFGKAKIEIGWLPPGVYGRTDPATGTVSLSHWLFTEEPQIEIIATLLTHEGGHVAKLIEERSEIEVREAGHETSVYFWGDIRGFSDVYVLSGNFSFEVFDVYNLLEDVWQARRHLPFEEYLKYIDILEGVIPP